MNVHLASLMSKILTYSDGPLTIIMIYQSLISNAIVCRRLSSIRTSSSSDLTTLSCTSLTMTF
jgi:hypothetical protein